MNFEVFPSRSYAVAAAVRIAGLLPRSGSVVITGGHTAATVYRALAGISPDWSAIDVLFSDERSVHPTHAESNFGMARDTLLDVVAPRSVQRVRGELAPDEAARAYEADVAPIVRAGLDLTILGMGDDCHICALFPGSPALEERDRLAVPVDRPDGLNGVTLTPVALAASHRVVVVVTGESKASAAQRVLEGDEPVAQCPARLLEPLDTTFVLDEAAASSLDDSRLQAAR